MRRLFLALVFPFLLYASDVEVLASFVDVNGSIMTASGDVVVFYDDMMISADYLRYDRDKKIIDLWGEVHMLKDALYYALGNEVHIDIENKTRIHTPLYLHEKTNQTWLSAKSAASFDKVYKLKKATISSCNPENPDWRMEYSSGTYDSQEKYIDMFNVVLFAGDIPFFYLPYIGFSTDDTRRSGLLRPSAGWSEFEGWFYEQPLYIVLSDRMDLELRYQHRERRGEGWFLDFRFVDSPNSRGHINLGYFQEQNNDAKKFGWVNEEHRGASVDYIRTHLFDKYFGADTRDMLYADIDLYNDIDYVNLQLRTGQMGATQTVTTSRVNYNLAGNEHAFGVYGKYFFDSRSLNDPTITNDETLQELPKVQYHKYVNDLLVDNLTYSLDLTTNFRSRPELTNSTESVIAVPLTYTLPLFDDYLNVMFTENMVLSSIAFSNVEMQDKPVGYYEGGTYLSSSQMLNINTDLIKKYDQTTHAIRFGATYLFPGLERMEGFYENKYEQFNRIGRCTPGDLCEFTQRSIEPVQRQVNVDFTQYLFDNSGREWFYHKARQPISVEGETSYRVFENEMRLTLLNGLMLYNDSFYNHDFQKIEKMSSSIGYTNSYVTTMITNLWQYNPYNDQESDFYTYMLSMRPNKFLTLSGNYAYDNMLKVVTNWQTSIQMQKRCWAFTLRYAENIIPTSESSIIDRFIYASVELRPFGGIDYDYRMIQERE